MSNKINIDYAKTWFAKNYPEERIFQIHEYDNCFIFDSVPKGVEKQYGNIVRNPIGLNKKTGEYFPYNPLKYETIGKEVVHIIEDITEIYLEAGKEIVNKLR